MRTTNGNVFYPKIALFGRCAVTCLSLLTADTLQSASFGERISVWPVEVGGGEFRPLLRQSLQDVKPLGLTKTMELLAPHHTLI